MQRCLSITHSAPTAQGRGHGRDAEFKAFRRAFELFQAGQIDRRIADQTIERQALGGKIGDEAAYPRQ